MISSSTFAVQRLGSAIGTALGVDDQALDDPVEAADDDAEIAAPELEATFDGGQRARYESGDEHSLARGVRKQNHN